MATIKMVKIQSSDGEVFEIDIKAAQKSELIKVIFEDLSEDDDSPAPVQVKSTILKKVIEWANHHKDDISTRQEGDNEISQWDQKFLKIDQGTLFELLLAANYLDIIELFDVTCKTVANMIKGKTPEDIRKFFNVLNDFSPQEEEQIRKETEWCEEKNN